MHSNRRLFVLPALLIAGALLAAGCSSTSASTTGALPEANEVSPTATQTAPPADYRPPTQIPHEKNPYDKRKIKIVGISPNSGKYGVAMPVTITFNTDVPKRYRAQVENLITVAASRDIPDVAWGWTDAHTIVLRGKKFWPANTTITVNAKLPKTLIPNSKHQEVAVISGGDTITMKVGRALVVRVNASTVQAVVYRNGVKVRTMPTSLGKPGWETRSGIKVVQEKYIVRRMTSEAVGETTETYDLQVPYSVRITPTGEFIHGAPWAVSRLGRYNGSHGCTNLGMSDAKWFYDNSRMGDPVVTKNTGRPMETWNGLGGPWNFTWNEWLENSYAGARTIGPAGTVSVS
jgi:lipoprotein-anchoring transpeptidase ErfK/SrfK